jgi:hypothetical protein
MKFPGPNYNQLITKDPQIVKVGLDLVEWGSRMELQNKLANEQDQPGGAPSKPSAPAMTLKHTG